jgi:hypothetical protein
MYCLISYKAYDICDQFYGTLFSNYLQKESLDLPLFKNKNIIMEKEREVHNRLAKILIKVQSENLQGQPRIRGVYVLLNTCMLVKTSLDRKILLQ